MRTFYELSDIPVHCVLLMPTREQALSYPRRDLRLGFCPLCGFIANTLFDPGVQEYSGCCEETQGFSPTFNEFARDLAKRWVRQYQLQGSSALEIGCGKGEFLSLLIESGMDHGTGIDPAFVPGRLGTADLSRLEFIRDFYGEKYALLQADAVCCRHTLEHIGPVAAFLRTIRRATGDRPGSVVLFELPDTLRILREAAFWDIYYEHCSYFTTGSLARLFRRTGYELLNLDLEFGDQYIVLAAKPSTTTSPPSLDGEEDLDRVRGEVDHFPARVTQLKNRWLSTINELHGEGKRLVIWGGGSKAVSFLTTLGLQTQIEFVVDINPHKQGKFVPGTGHAVESPATLKSQRPDCVLLMNPVYEEEVRAHLQSLGLNPEILPV